MTTRLWLHKQEIDIWYADQDLGPKRAIGLDLEGNLIEILIEQEDVNVAKNPRKDNGCVSKNNGSFNRKE
jgi:hypothetical protein